MNKILKVITRVDGADYYYYWLSDKDKFKPADRWDYPFYNCEPETIFDEITGDEIIKEFPYFVEAKVVLELWRQEEPDGDYDISDIKMKQYERDEEFNIRQV